MTKTRLALLLLLAAIIVTAVYCTHLIRRGFSTSEQPSSIERLVARAVRNLAIPSSAKNKINPFSATQENLTEGGEHFADHCAACHSNDGSGNTEMGPNFYPKVPDMRLAPTQKLTDGQIFYIIQNGVRLTGMPAWGASHQAEDTWKLVLFVRHLPDLTPAEEKDMERFNPESDVDRQEEQQERQFLNGGK